ncbi:MAG: isoprenylcysteine carboxylmethyltransferase family protein [Zoogloeaceae bacterium]|nr:isoprenylcysteine carboxylmethyltransferase family protein [Zoogloeaceae bacterium]
MSIPLGDLPLFVLGSAALAWVSRKPLRQPGSHGFWRFFAWEAILALSVLNRDPVGPQFFSETLLQFSLVPAGLGLLALVRQGRTSPERPDAALLPFERTTQLVTQGIYRHIRHPMYAALLGLTWGMCLRAPSSVGIGLATLASYLLLCTARAEERECIAYFGQPYRDYMKRSWRFVPWIY